MFSYFLFVTLLQSPHTVKITVPSSALTPPAAVIPIPAKRLSLCKDDDNDTSPPGVVTITHRNPSREEIPVPAKRTTTPADKRAPPVPAVRRRSLAADPEDYDEPISHSTINNSEFEDYDIPAIRHARASSIKNQKRK